MDSTHRMLIAGITVFAVVVLAFLTIKHMDDVEYRLGTRIEQVRFDLISLVFDEQFNALAQERTRTQRIIADTLRDEITWMSNVNCRINALEAGIPVGTNRIWSRVDDVEKSILVLQERVDLLRSATDGEHAVALNAEEEIDDKAAGATSDPQRR
jgi:hypothetical protein